MRIQCSLKTLTKYTRRSVLSQLGQNFDPLGFGSPFFLKARLILQKLAVEKFDWDAEVPEGVVKEWNVWLHSLEMLKDFSLPRWYFLNAGLSSPGDDVKYQLHGFSDASNVAFSSVIYLRRLVNGVPAVSFVFGKCKVVLANQNSWPIARKELVAALNTTKLLKQASEGLQISNCSNFFWCDSFTVLQWLKNPDLRLSKFITRRVDHILMLSSKTEWRFCPSNLNAADVGSRPDRISKIEARALWLKGPSFLRQHRLPLVDSEVAVTARRMNLSGDGVDVIGRLIERAPSLYQLQKRIAYLISFVDWFKCKLRKGVFVKPVLNAAYLERALLAVVKFVQSRVYGDAICLTQEKSADALEEMLKKCQDTASPTQKDLKELRSLKKYRPCVEGEGMLRLEGRLNKSLEISWATKHPLILPSKHPLTRLVVLFYHYRDCHCGVQHTLLSTRQKIWIANGNSAVRRYLRDCGVCAIKRARPIRQLMSDLPLARLAANKKPFFHCGIDYLGPLTFVEGRSHRKAWGLPFTCMASRAIHVELVTALSLDEFLLAFTRFVDIRGQVDTIYSDNGSTFQAGSRKLPELIESKVLNTSLRKKGINWEFIPPYAPAQGGAWEAMVKQFKIVLSNNLDTAMHKPKFVELLTYVGSAVRIVNERPLIPLSDDPRDFTVITPASLLTPYLDQHVVVGQPHDRDMLRRDYRFNLSLSQQFWKKWIAFYLPWLQGRKKWWRVSENLKPGQLVVMGSLEDISRRGRYQLGRIEEVIPQIRNGKPIVRRAKIAVAKVDENTGDVEVQYVLRDVSRIAPVENT